MANFWERDEAAISTPKKSSRNFWDNDSEVKEPQQKVSSKKPFNVLPLSEDEKGNINFDSNAGVFGAIKRAVSLPKEVWTGEVDPNSPEGMNRTMELATMVAPGPAPLSVKPSAVSRAMLIPKETPTTQELLRAGGSGYDLARAQGVSYTPSAIEGLSGSLRKGLNEQGIASVNYPGSHAFLDTLEGLKENPSVSLTDLLAHREALNDVRGEGKATSTIRQGINKLIFSPESASVASGEAKEAGSIVKNADANFAAGSRAKTLDKLETKAVNRAGSANSGMNLDNQIRGKVSSLLEKENDLRGFSPEEVSSLENVANGNIVRNAIRKGGNMLGGGGGLGASAMFGLGGYYGGLLSPEAGAMLATALPTAGYGLKSTGNLLTQRALQKSNKKVRQRSPLYENAPLDRDALSSRYGLLRMLMSGDNSEN